MGSYIHLYFRNANDAFRGLCQGFMTGDFSTDLTYEHTSTYSPPIGRTKSRYGDVLVIQEPVCITYKNPLERVLFNKHRNCNPFFHMIEALWTLAGCDAIEPLLYFNSKVADFSDDGKTWYGAYGKRWAKFHQLETAIGILEKDRTCRRVVLQQWEASDLTRVLNKPTCRDVPCNTEVMFLPRCVVDYRAGRMKSEAVEYLDMAVINRSNDLIWGALGSNYVTFSMLLEYVAAFADYLPGLYHQVTNNLHVYTGSAGKAGLECYPPDFEVWSQKFNPLHFCKAMPLAVTDYRYSLSPQRSLGETKEDFDDDLMTLFSGQMQDSAKFPYRTCFFRNVIVPMLLAWGYHKQRDYPNACLSAGKIGAQDWNVACTEWLIQTADNFRMKEIASA